VRNDLSRHKVNKKVHLPTSDVPVLEDLMLLGTLLVTRRKTV
jgi:hypothetical protein